MDDNQPHQSSDSSRDEPPHGESPQTGNPPQDNNAPQPDNNQLSRTRTMIRNNPGHSTSFLITTVLAICPALLTAPLMPLLGFTAAGPALGISLVVSTSLHANMDSRRCRRFSRRGLPVLGWYSLGLRLLQSAAMGGWGSGIVAGIVQAAAYAGAAPATLIRGWLGGDADGRDGGGHGHHGEEH